MANEIALKYGCNPNQKPARIFMEDGSDLPVTVLSGKPGYINFLDALNGWQLVTELKAATGLPAAASFKHVSPAGAAVATPMTEVEKKACFVEKAKLSPLATAYARARGADRMSSFGDWVSLSDVCDKETARLISREVSDGVIAPGYTDEALEILTAKRKGAYNVVQIDPNYTPAALERKQVFGVTFEQGHNNVVIDKAMLENIPTAVISSIREGSMSITVVRLSFAPSENSRTMSTPLYTPARRISVTTAGTRISPMRIAFSPETQRIYRQTAGKRRNK